MTIEIYKKKSDLLNIKRENYTISPVQAMQVGQLEDTEKWLSCIIELLARPWFVPSYSITL